MKTSSIQDGEKEFKVGQFWKLRNGSIILIESVNSTEISCSYPIKSTDHRHWTKKGCYYYEDGENTLDIIELIKDVPSEDKQENKYTVEEVFVTLYKVIGDNYSCYISDIEEHLIKIKDPEYQKYLELKAKFE